MARKKSSFYHTRWHRCGLNVERAAEVLGVSVQTVEDWDRDGNELAERFLALWDRKHIGIEGWDGFMFSRGILRWKNRRWTAKTLLLWQDQAETPGSRYFCESLFWASQPNQAAKMTRPLMPSAPRFVRVTSFRPNKGIETSALA